MSLLGFAGFVGLLLGSYFLNPLGDYWGRSITFKLCMVFQIIANIFLLCTKGYNFLIFSLFIFGLASAGRVTVGHIWFLENLPEDQ